ncbi:MAG: HAD family hydrolase [Acaryochloridaceae cyanobacterium SU_2_1]|nr:HAD family hydrolase [Acaryochloridaceae cyanobacterium SU_2_1]
MTGVEALVTPQPWLTTKAKLADHQAPLTVLCDLDGPLIDVSQRYYKTYQLALAETQSLYRSQNLSLLLTPLRLDQFWQMKQSKYPDQEIALASGLGVEQVEIFLSQVQRLVNQPLLLREDLLQPGVHASLQQLQEMRARLVVVTLRCQAQAVQLLEQYQLSHFFTFIRGTRDHQAAYQNYALYKQALLEEILACLGPSSPEQHFWMIGDTEADIIAAQAMNIKTIALTCGMRNQAFLEPLQPTSIQSNLAAATRYLLESSIRYPEQPSR